MSADVTDASYAVVSLDSIIVLTAGSVACTVVLFTGMLLPAGFVVSADGVVWSNVVVSS